MYGSEHQKRISNLLIYGFGAIVVGGLGFVFTAMGGGLFTSQAAAVATAGVFFLVALAGGAMLVGAMVVGGKQAFGNDADKAIETANDVYIISLLILNKDQSPIYDPDMFDEDELRCYVQVEFADGRKREFETSLAVMGTIGDGMRGNITYQGKWLSQFVMVPKPTDRPYGR